jgi:hypothetical protein
VHYKNKTMAFALIFIIATASALFSTATIYFITAQGQTTPPTATPTTNMNTTPTPTVNATPTNTTTMTTTTLNISNISQALGTPIVVYNNQTGIVTAILVRQAPIITEPGGIVDNNFTLMNSVVEFMAVPGATSNQTVYARGFFGLLENETNTAIHQAVAFNMTILNLHPFSLQDTPKLQFLHWQTTGSLNTILANIKNIVGNTSIGTTQPMTYQTALNVSYLASSLNGSAMNGSVVNVAIFRHDGNITAPSSFTGTGNTTITLNGFATMGTLFEFMSLQPNATGANATSGNVMVMGDFALKETEVNAVEHVLMNSTAHPLVNVTITSLHDHMLMETPKMAFLHFESMGDLNQTITMLNAAINQTSTRGNSTGST